MARYLRPRPERRSRPPRDQRDAAAHLANYQRDIKLIFSGRPLKLVRPGYQEKVL